ncbi:hypothetical protein HMPREF3038_02146 [Akkermansia sp. KLE1797]|nr:hypothetical protein HMPREF3038_02146 [Akkermansia sp. KLE1797]KXU53519.1 hypothetical protein HMPREF3039_02240 [Akkermansia sp. KLE1798]
MESFFKGFPRAVFVKVSIPPDPLLPAFGWPAFIVFLSSAKGVIPSDADALGRMGKGSRQGRAGGIRRHCLGSFPYCLQYFLM